MKVEIKKDALAMGQYAAAVGAEVIRQAIADRGAANIIVATGASQFNVLGSLIKEEGIDWSKVTGFHLDEYLGLPRTHPASFCGYLKKRCVDHLPLAAFH